MKIILNQRIVKYWILLRKWIFVTQYFIMWIARNKGGLLYLFDNIPIKHEKGYWYSQPGYDEIELCSRLFPEVTWENSPKQIEFKLID